MKQSLFVALLGVMLQSSIVVQTGLSGDLTAEMADAIVATEEAANAAANRAKRQAMDAAAALAVQTQSRPDGTRLIVRRVSAAPTPPQESGEGQVLPTHSPAPLELGQRQAPLHERQISLSATVFDHRLTQLRWWHDGDLITAWSNIDFNLLRGLSQFEHQGIPHALFLGIGNESTADDADRQAQARAQGFTLPPAPVLPTPPEEPASFRVDSLMNVDPATDPTLAGVRALHRYYAAHEAELKAAYQRGEALREARERYLSEHPPVPQDTVIHFAPTAASQQAEAVARSLRRP